MCICVGNKIQVFKIAHDILSLQKRKSEKKVDELNKKIRNLWIKALKGSGKAYRELGIIFLKGKTCKRDDQLAKLCLDKAAELGDEQGYLLYHRIFSKNGKVIDDLSYGEMCRDYREAKSWREKRRLKNYLELKKILYKT